MVALITAFFVLVIVLGANHRPADHTARHQHRRRFSTISQQVATAATERDLFQNIDITKLSSTHGSVPAIPKCLELIRLAG